MWRFLTTDGNASNWLLLPGHTQFKLTKKVFEETMQRFQNKVTFVTGAASGIGLETVIRLASEGANLTLCDIDNDGMKETAAVCQQYDGNVVEQYCDVGDYDSCAAAINTCIEHHGHLWMCSVISPVLRNLSTLPTLALTNGSVCCVPICRVSFIFASWRCHA